MPPVLLFANDSILGDELFMIGNVISTFISVKKQAALAIIRVTSILNASTQVPHVPRSALSNNSVTLKGQVLQLTQKPQVNNENHEGDNDSSLKDSESVWLWDNGGFVSFPSDSGSTASAHMPTQKSTVIEVKAPIAQVVKPVIHATDTLTT